MSHFSGDMYNINNTGNQAAVEMAARSVGVLWMQVGFQMNMKWMLMIGPIWDSEKLGAELKIYFFGFFFIVLIVIIFCISFT